MNKAQFGRFNIALDRSYPSKIVSKEGVAQFVETGVLSVDSALYANGFGMLRSVSERLMRSPLRLTRRVDAEGWHNVDKVTLFRYPKGLVEHAHGMSLHSPELSVMSDWSDKVIRGLGRKLIELGKVDAGMMLEGHLAQRAIINRMRGSPADPAVLGIHTDPSQEEGANLALSVGRGVSLVNGRAIGDNTLSIYACADVAEALDIEQTPHGYSSEVERFSVVFTNFVTQ